MQKLFSIGETSEINGVSIKTLRYYDKIGLLKPAYIDKTTLYRFYTYDQFIYIDLIKRYKDTGMSLKDIKDILDTQNIDALEQYLALQTKILEDEQKKLEQMKHNIDWLSTFLGESKKIQPSKKVSIRTQEERLIIYCPALKGQDIYEMDMDLRQTVSSGGIKGGTVLNPYGYILDKDDFMQGKISFTASYAAISHVNKPYPECIKTLPAGEYLCFHTPILSDDFDISFLIEEIKKRGCTPELIIANEYIKSLFDPIHSPYEIQVLINRH